MSDRYLKDCCFNSSILKHYTNREFDNFPLELIHLIIYGYPMLIYYVPFVCEYPGQYIIIQDLYHKDLVELHAITITAPNVHINGNNYTLYAPRGRTFNLMTNSFLIQKLPVRRYNWIKKLIILYSVMSKLDNFSLVDL